MMCRNIILALVLLSFPLSAAENVKAIGAVAKANVKAFGAVAEANIKAVGAVDNTGSAATYLINQNFEGTGYDNSESWTENAGTPDEDYATSPAPLVGSQSCQLNDGGVDETITSPTFTALAEAWFYFVMTPDTLGASMSTYAQFRDASTSFVSAQYDAEGNWRISMSGGNSSATVDGMTADTVYEVLVHYVAGSGANAVGSVEFVPLGGGTFDGAGNNFTQFTSGTATASTDRVRLTSTDAASMIVDRVLVDNVAIGNNP